MCGIRLRSSSGSYLAATSVYVDMTNTFTFEELKDAPLIVDALYKGGNKKNMGDEVLSNLLPRTENSGGFRKTYVRGSKTEFAYLTLYTTMSEIEWPDYMNYETGIFRYYGDNRQPGHELHDTVKKGNMVLRSLYEWLNDPEQIIRIPPILIFKKEHGRDVRFLGLAVPGCRDFTEDQELVAFWRTIGSERFQNYEAYFTVLDTGDDPIPKEWLEARVNGNPDADRMAPEVWLNFHRKGRVGIRPLMARRIQEWPGVKAQLPNDDEGIAIINAILKRYEGFPQGFEHCAVRIVQMMDLHFSEFDVTRPWRDGGRDATGRYLAGSNECGIAMECSLEAKLYSSNQGVGVRWMSRLISRIKYRQFGIMITTSYISKQAYDEVKEDGHPIILITGRDIVRILRSKHYSSENIDAWLDSIKEDINLDSSDLDDRHPRFERS